MTRLICRSSKKNINDNPIASSNIQNDSSGTFSLRHPMRFVNAGGDRVHNIAHIHVIAGRADRFV